MQYSHRVHFADENEMPDDIDCLFELLPHVAPPSSLIKQILEQTPMSYASDAFPVSQLWYLHDQPAAMRQRERLTMAPQDGGYKRSHVC